MQTEVLCVGDMVHLLWFVKEMPEGKEDIELLIGAYSTDSEAKAAIERVRNKRGFAQYQDGFQISTYPLNRDHWTDGFVIE
jgi:homoserine kinase type II